MRRLVLGFGCILVLLVPLLACSRRERPRRTRPIASGPAAIVPAQPQLPDELPADLGEMKIPADNQQSDAKIALGHQLFFDTRLSVDGSRACYSCHQNDHGNGGEEPIATGALEKKLTRHSPVIWNVGYLPALYWDGRAASLEEQARGAWAGDNMGVGEDKLQQKADELAKLPAYQKAFAAAFPGAKVTPDIIVKALASYERTLVCNDTAYDRFAKGDRKALTKTQQRGLALFLSPDTGCTSCHAPPFFSVAYGTPAGAYFNVGIGTKKPHNEVDVGRQAVTKKEEDWAAFKPPSLRNAAKSAPYFHDGSAATLADAVRTMAGGGIPNPQLSPLVGDRKLTAAQINDIVTFLGALDCGKLEEPSSGSPAH